MKRLLLLGFLLPALLVVPARPSRAATFVVDDPADPVPTTGTLTLRQAITAANLAPGPHHITFGFHGHGLHVISLQSELPPIVMNNVWIDGYSQQGASPGASPPGTAVLTIVLNGLGAGFAHGLILLSSFNTIEGLCIVNFERDGIRIQGTPEPGTRSNLVYGNFIGTDPTGTLAAGNCTNPAGNIWAGVDILCTPGDLTFCTDNTVDRNLISGNKRCGVQISSCPPSDCWANHVSSNLIGTDVSGMLALGNSGSGVVLAEGTHDNVINTNVISANGANGIDVTGNYFTIPPASTDHNQFTTNLVGLDQNGTGPLGNGGRGVSLGIFELSSFFAGFCRQNTFTTNTVAHNGMAGFSVWEHPSTNANADENTFSLNQVHDNAGLGIDLGDNGVTPNDPGDPDAGANQEVNFPVILNANYLTGTTTITGSVDNGAQVHVYRAKSDPSGYGEGELWLASASPDPLGNWTTTITSVVPGDPLTALAMDWGAGGVYANTSEFSPFVPVVNIGDVAGNDRSHGFALTIDGANPFTTTTSFKLRLPAPGPVRLCLYDAAGKQVRTLVRANVGAGEHGARWDGLDAAGRALPAGIYFVELAAANHRSTTRVVKLR